MKQLVFGLLKRHGLSGSKQKIALPHEEIPLDKQSNQV
jgi:hypothetical protein